jgi:hypothetical protein
MDASRYQAVFSLYIEQNVILYFKKMVEPRVIYTTWRRAPASVPHIRPHGHITLYEQ